MNRKLNRRARMLRSRRRGVSAFFVALALVVLFGSAALAVDFSILVNDRNRAQRAADAAALAGAYNLPSDTTKARQFAKDVAAQNGVPVTDSQITFLDNNNQIRVETSIPQSLYFARVIGFTTKTVQAHAIASVTATTVALPKVVPISITYTTVAQRRAVTSLPLGSLLPVSVVDSTPVTLTIPRVQSAPYGLNEVLVFDLRPTNAKSPTQMSSQLLSGYDDVQIGDSSTSLNASDTVVDNNFTPPMAQRFQQASQSPWNDTWTGDVFTSVGSKYDDILNGTSRADNPRVMNMIVNSPVSQNNGNTQHIVLGFAPVYVQSWDGDDLVIRFLPDTLFGSGGTGGGSRKIRLIE